MGFDCERLTRVGKSGGAVVVLYTRIGTDCSDVGASAKEAKEVNRIAT